jgi:hypothetical protein
MADSFASLLERKYRWPKAGDRVTQHVSKPTDAYVSEEAYERAIFLWRGYFKAGKLLAEECERRPFEVNYLIYPMMFNYRHGLEVAMKEIISEYGAAVNVSLSDDKDHNLLELWKLYKLMSDELSPQGGDGADKAVGLVIQDFHELDRSAVAFRYSTNKDGAKFKFASGVVTIARLKDVMEGCQHYFEGSDEYYHAQVQASPGPYDY